MMLTESTSTRAPKPALLPAAAEKVQPTQSPALMAGSTTGALPIRLPLKTELQAMSFEERVSVLMACADHRLEQMDLLEDPDRSEPLTPWERRQLTSYRG